MKGLVTFILFCVLLSGIGPVGSSKNGTSKGSSKNGASKGKSKQHSGRIVGGREVQPPHALPWQAALVAKEHMERVACGATILCPNFVMSAAHCIEAEPNSKNGQLLPESDWLVVVGIHTITDKTEKSRTNHHIKRWVAHPNRKKWTYDYALVELQDPIVFRPEARPIFLPEPGDHNKLSESTTLLVSGWGDLKDSAQKGSAKLMYAPVPYVPESKCMKAYEKMLETGVESAFCAGYIDQGGIDACQGDSGGPLVFYDDNKVKLIGVVSVGAVCGMAGYPGIYAKMTLVLDWVTKVTGDCNAKACQQNECITKRTLGSGLRYFRQGVFYKKKL